MCKETTIIFEEFLLVSGLDMNYQMNLGPTELSRFTAAGTYCTYCRKLVTRSHENLTWWSWMNF